MLDNDDDFDRIFNKGLKWGIGVWVAVLLVNVAIWGVVIWAIIKLVNHFTGSN